MTKNTPAFQGLIRAAQQEAADFCIDPAQLADRPEVDGYAIDGLKTQSRDSAILLTEGDAGAVLHFSAADVGSFIGAHSALRGYAAERLFTRSKPNGKIAPMLPPEISNNKLSLNDGQLRPVVTAQLPVDERGNVGELALTYGVIRAKTITPQEVDERYYDEGPDGQFARLELFARKLYAARLSLGNAAMQSLQSLEARTRTSAVRGIGHFIVEESTIAVNVAVSRYMYERDIPGICRRLVPAGRRTTRLHYMPIPDDYEDFERVHSVPFSSALRNYAGLVDHINLATYHKGEAAPFENPHHHDTSKRLNSMARLLRQKGKTPRNAGEQTKQAPPAPEAESQPNTDPGQPHSPNVVKRLLRVSGRARLGFACFTDTDPETGTVTADAHITLDGVVHQLPEAVKHEAQETQTPNHVLNTLATYAAQNKLPVPRYEVVAATVGTGYRCIVHCVDASGAEQTFTAFGPSGQRARQVAATGVLHLLYAQKETAQSAENNPPESSLPSKDS